VAFDLPAAWVAVIGVAVACVIAYWRGRPSVALGVLFAASSFSGLTAPSPFGSVRMEQLAIVLLFGLMLIRRPTAFTELALAVPAVSIFAVLYLGANVASSAVLAEVPAESLKIAAWLGVSMVAMLVAGTLVRDDTTDMGLPWWIVGAASIQVLVGLAAVTSQALFGTAWGVQTNDVVLGKTNGLSWEANILAINLAMALAFVVVPTGLPDLGRSARIAIVAWLAFGLGLAYSRGGLIALAVAVGVVGGAVAWYGRARIHSVFRARLVPIGGLSALSLVIAVTTIQGQTILGRMGVGVPPDTVVIDDGGPPPSARPQPTGEGSTTPRPTATPEIRRVGTGDTLRLRLRNMQIGLSEVAKSPLIGLGTDSYRQRHVEPSCRCPAHIANLPAAALYDSGAIGLVGLLGLLGSALWASWRTRAWPYLAASVVMIVGYQVTDAFRFASNWVLLGTIFGVWATLRTRRVIESA